MRHQCIGVLAATMRAGTNRLAGDMQADRAAVAAALVAEFIGDLAMRLDQRERERLAVHLVQLVEELREAVT